MRTEYPGVRPKPARLALCLVSAGLGLALLGSAWHPFTPVSLGVWMELVVPLLRGGQGLSVLRTSSIPASLCPFVAGIAFSLPLAVLSRGSQSSPKVRITLICLLGLAFALSGTVAGAVRLGMPETSWDFLSQANIGATLLLGLALVATALRLWKAGDTRQPARSRFTLSLGLAGICLISYVLLPLGVLLLAVAYLLLPFTFAYGDAAM